MSRSEAAAQLGQLAVATGIFAEERPSESLRFIHLSICEYLAGKALANADDKRFRAVLDQAADGRGGPLYAAGQRLWETVVFAVALANDARREAAVDRLAAVAPDELVLRVVRESQAYDHRVFPATLAAITKKVTGTAPRCG